MTNLHKIFEDLPRRSKYELWAESLELCLHEPRTQTWLLHELRVNTITIKEILEFLISQGLLIENPPLKSEFKTYQTSLKGKDALLKFYSLINDYFQ